MNSPPLAQSADKHVLFARLGLNEQTHKILLQEAQAARDSLSRNPQNLTDQSKANPCTHTPYKWDEISETAKHREILTVVHNAPPHTKYYYSLGRYQTNVNEENWVARWYLWHSFRYRDNRDARSRMTTSGGLNSHGGQQVVHHLKASRVLVEDTGIQPEMIVFIDCPVEIHLIRRNIKLAGMEYSVVLIKASNL